MKAFLQKLQNHGARISVIENEKLYTYSDLYNKIEEFITEISLKGIQRGHVVILYGDYSFDSISLLFALVANKNIVVPITRIPQAELDERKKESNADWLISVSQQGINIEGMPLTEKHAIILQLNQHSRSGLILFSSGMTGKPKAMIHDFDNLISAYVDKRGKELIFLVFLLFDHIGGINTLLNTLSMGSSIVIPERRDADYICLLIERHKINILPSSPTFLNLMLMNLKQKKYNLSSLIMITYGTEPMPESLLIRVKEQFPKVKLLQTFGTSETGIARTSSRSSSSTLMKIEDGDTQFKIVNGELWLKSKTQIIGYLNYSMESFTEDGWFRTGDIAEEAAEGYIRILGRLKEVINVGGEKVLPSEVESVVLQLPEVDDCIAYAMPNMITGQAVGLNITSSISDEKFLKKLIKNHCKVKLELYKNPVKINLINKLEFNSRFKKIRIRKD